MRPKSWVSLAGVAAMILASTILISFGPAPAAAYENHWGANYFPNVELTDQYGHKLHFYDDLLKGKIVAIEQFYTHCIDICPLETARLAQVQKMLGDRVGKDIFFYSISIDPKRDTPEAMKEYADTYHAGPGWLFLTGKKEDITLINKKLGFQDPIPGDRDGHSPHLLLGNEATGQWLRNNALDNPRFLAIMIGDWMNSWTSAKKMTSGQSYANAPAIKYDDHGKYMFFTQCAACHTIGGGDALYSMGFEYFCFLSAIDWMPSPFGRGEDDPTEPPPERPTEIRQGVVGGATCFQVSPASPTPSATSG